MSKEKMINVKCSSCMKNMQMPESFLKAGEKRGMKMPHICTDCTNKISSILEDKMPSFMKDIDEQMKKIGKNDEIAEQLAAEITYENIDSLLDELEDADASEEDKIKEAFYRGAWMVLFLIGNNHEPGFLEKEAIAIRDFQKHIKEREERK